MDNQRYKVNEQFDSVQGEGLWVGTPATFIRLQGCPVGCSWCDSGPLADEIEGKRRTNGTTANTWGPGGEWKTVEEIANDVWERHVIITGGEPLIWDLDPLIHRLWKMGCFVQVETSGYCDLKGHLAPDWVTVSPKPNLKFNVPSHLASLTSEVKFVIDQNIQLSDIRTLLRDFRQSDVNLQAVVLMPEGCPPSKESIEKTLRFLHDDGFQEYPVRFGDRLQYRINMR